MAKVAVVAGAGPGNGAAIARRFPAAAGFAVAILARNGDVLAALAKEITESPGAMSST